MSQSKIQRPQIKGVGEVIEVLDSGRLYRVKMKNEHVAYAVVPKDGPVSDTDNPGAKVEVEFSPYDMSRCKIAGWLS